MVQRAREKVQSILGSHQPRLLEPALEREIDLLVAEIETRHK
jgi:trimethylamine:corrinoid methyltransferase-like protein